MRKNAARRRDEKETEGAAAKRKILGGGVGVGGSGAGLGHRGPSAGLLVALPGTPLKTGALSAPPAR